MWQKPIIDKALQSTGFQYDQISTDQITCQMCDNSSQSYTNSNITLRKLEFLLKNKWKTCLQKLFHVSIQLFMKKTETNWCLLSFLSDY